MKERRFTPFVSKYIIIVLAMLGIICVSWGAFLLADSVIFMRNAEETTGTVSKVHIINRVKKRDICDVEVEYTVDGVKYEYYYANFARRNFIIRSDYEGASVRLLYSRDNPAKVRPARKPYAQPMSVLFAGIAAAAGTMYLVRRNRFYENILRNGAVLDAVVIDVEQSTVVHSGGRRKGIYRDTNVRPYTERSSRIICEWKNPVTGDIFQFKSKSVDVFFDPYVGETVRVYADPNDYSKYYVDIDDLLSKPFKN